MPYPDIIFKPSIKSVEDQKDIKNILTDFQFESEPNLIKGEATSLRNQNIQTYFFNKLSSKKISAKVLSIKSTNTEGGLLSLELIFNGVKKIYDANYSIIDNTIELRCHLELADFDAMNAGHHYGNLLSPAYIRNLQFKKCFTKWLLLSIK